MNGRSWKTDYYQSVGPLIKSETHSDEKSTVKNGRFSWYDPAGKLDSTGYFSNNLRDKSWYYYNNADSAMVTKIIEYQNGNIIKVTDITIEKTAGTDTTAKDEQESEFPGGQQGWLKFLMKTLRYPDRAVEYEKQGEVRILFIVNKIGKVEDPLLIKSVEMSLDDETLRVLSAIPAWIPGSKNGVKVDTYKVQPLKFRLTNG